MPSRKFKRPKGWKPGKTPDFKEHPSVVRYRDPDVRAWVGVHFLDGHTHARFVANEDCCEHCAHLDGREQRIATLLNWQYVLPHPNCRCHWETYKVRRVRKGEDMIDTLDDDTLSPEEFMRPVVRFHKSTMATANVQGGAGLVQKEIQVTRGGQTFTEKRWVRAGAPLAERRPKGHSDLAEIAKLEAEQAQAAHDRAFKTSVQEKPQGQRADVTTADPKGVHPLAMAAAQHAANSPTSDAKAQAVQKAAAALGPNHPAVHKLAVDLGVDLQGAKTEADVDRSNLDRSSVSPSGDSGAKGFAPPMAEQVRAKQRADSEFSQHAKQDGTATQPAAGSMPANAKRDGMPQIPESVASPTIHPAHMEDLKSHSQEIGNLRPGQHKVIRGVPVKALKDGVYGVVVHGQKIMVHGIRGASMLVDYASKASASTAAFAAGDLHGAGIQQGGVAGAQKLEHTVEQKVRQGVHSARIEKHKAELRAKKQETESKRARNNSNAG